jgi:hypothetical protein
MQKNAKFLFFGSMLVILYFTTLNLNSNQSTATINRVADVENEYESNSPFIKNIRKGQAFNTKDYHLVFFHIQKTSGTNWNQEFPLRILMRDPKDEKIYPPCNSEINWQCGKWHYEEHLKLPFCAIHPRFPKMKNCYRENFPELNSRELMFYTILREPTTRFISEWKMLADRNEGGPNGDYYPKCIQKKNRDISKEKGTNELHTRRV